MELECYYMAVKIGFSMNDLHYFTIKDITEMFDMYAETMGGKKNKPSQQTYSGAEGLLDFVRGN